MRVFTATLATAINTFSPMPTGLAAFLEHGVYFKASTHPAEQTWASALLIPAHERALREELLADLRAAMPVDLVLLGLHGAMVAGGAAGDATFILRRVLERGLTGVAMGPLWDPLAARCAFEAGVGARCIPRKSPCGLPKTCGRK